MMRLIEGGGLATARRTHRLRLVRMPIVPEEWRDPDEPHRDYFGPEKAGEP